MVRLFTLCLLCDALLPNVAVTQDYDPLQVLAHQPIRILDLDVLDKDRDRQIPIRVYLPHDNSERPPSNPVVLFSHGLGGTRTGLAYLGKHWAARGYVAVFLQHPGTDDSVWKNVPPWRRMQAMRNAASGENFLHRIDDVSAVLDQLTKWNKGPASNRQADKAAGKAVEQAPVDVTHTASLAGRLDLTRMGMSGHSFGARTTQAVAGQKTPFRRKQFIEPRIKAAIIMSPSAPTRGNIDTAFNDVQVPWLLMTGTRDEAPIGDQTPELRRRVFQALAPGDKFELVLHLAEHSAFTERALPGERQGRNPNHHRAILALSTAFWDSYLRRDESAQAWLEGDGPRSVLETDDIWQSK